jgi:UDP-N-acetyl-D-galactosamine dehydrogenase
MMEDNFTTNNTIAIIGLGYVGLPLALEFSKYFKVIGYDYDNIRIEQLKKGIDRNNEYTKDEIEAQNQLLFTSEAFTLTECNIYIITVPTPIDEFKNPDLSQLFDATNLVGNYLKINDVVIFESTVYPGCTEEDCVPILEKISGLKYNIDFFCGYSPERINPGDKINTLPNVVKLTSGSNPVIADTIDKLYAKIITAGTYKVESIKIAEAAKSIENAQRDLNISFMNELSLIFDKMGIDTQDVIDAASTKWNFLRFKPGLVGGHCIGVDPYYLSYKAQSLGYQPEVILSGRKVNDQMGLFIVNKTIKLMIQKQIDIQQARILILGLSFKENCSDTRNSKVFSIIEEFQSFGSIVDVYDPFVSNLSNVDFKINLLKNVYTHQYDAIVLTVAHESFKSIDLSHLKKEVAVVFDTKGIWPKLEVDARL